ncbi:hypothetical protein VOLCADRAFT_88719 [Volvox carteri f. nagariensis]|uniref:Uncharacterized protein n=1 Tax=Volvox carteri f. nagariensis TaxID=3068 RepID=D8TPS2_VOLCA|nr:uncharacterized protein VOLCADRAFT_88719 [Volvox carteri f. nagariensis]EFJ50405.1 hypothetical protein VOLCADRAFT_88719 [Volvox carteri f. nagariensis]|eukprot:XP_002948530.1 hypothetical protein VOLCADRAFT_88719 [Volvox carteri f. nagariensis]
MPRPILHTLFAKPATSITVPLLLHARPLPFKPYLNSLFPVTIPIPDFIVVIVLRRFICSAASIKTAVNCCTPLILHALRTHNRPTIIPSATAPSAAAFSIAISAKLAPPSFLISTVSGAPGAAALPPLGPAFLAASATVSEPPRAAITPSSKWPALPRHPRGHWHWRHCRCDWAFWCRCSWRRCLRPYPFIWLEATMAAAAMPSPSMANTATVPSPGSEPGTWTWGSTRTYQLFGILAEPE